MENEIRLLWHRVNLNRQRYLLGIAYPPPVPLGQIVRWRSSPYSNQRYTPCDGFAARCRKGILKLGLDAESG